MLKYELGLIISVSVMLFCNLQPLSIKPVRMFCIAMDRCHTEVESEGLRRREDSTGTTQQDLDSRHCTIQLVRGLRFT